MILRCILLLALVVFSNQIFAFPFKCDKSQTQCEVQSKRLTVGDKVVVLNDEKQLIAIGEVLEIRGSSRIVKITQKWGPLLRNHQMEFIEDSVYTNPSQTYPIYTPLSQWAWGAQLGVLTLGIGDTFTGSFLGGGLGYLLYGSGYLTTQIHYVNGGGKASDNLGEAGVQNVAVTAYGLSLGYTQVFSPLKDIGALAGGEFGLSSNTVTLDGQFDEKKVLNNRIVDGTNLYFRVVLSGYWRRDGIQPEVGFTFTRIHQSNNPGIYFGIRSSLN